MDKMRKADPEGTVEIPMGMVMALAEDGAAMTAFAALSDAERHRVIEAARRAGSRDEMKNIVRSLAGT